LSLKSALPSLHRYALVHEPISVITTLELPDRTFWTSFETHVVLVTIVVSPVQPAVALHVPSLAEARKMLDQHHFGLDKIKDR